MKNRITSLFEKKKEGILSVFYTAGFPKLDDTVSIASHLESSGVDLIEIGIPFSDPVADGPVIQESNKVALDNGMTVSKLLDQVKEIRKNVAMPIVLMGYINPVLQYGFEKFCQDASKAGVDGLILPDLPMDEFERDYKAACDANGLVVTFLISPTTSDDRIKKVVEATTSFVYAVSASSTTGSRTGFSADQEMYFKKLQTMKLKKPYLIGFGISNRQTFAKACEFASGAIVGSAFISMIKSSADLQNDIKHFISELR